MRTWWTIVSLVLVVCFVLVTTGAVLAREPVPQSPGEGQVRGGSRGFSQQKVQNVRYAGKAGLVGATAVTPAGEGETGGMLVEAEAEPEISAEAADVYGYTKKSVPLNWINVRGAPGAVLLDFEDFSYNYSAGVDLPFTFKFYDNTYTSVNAVLFGYLTFSTYPEGDWQSPIKYAGEPNNVIAPYWTPILKTDEGDIHTATGGDAPNRWIGFEWHNVSDHWTYGDNRFNFEAILFENGSILFQYQEMAYAWGYNYPAAGIEDSTGITGLISLKYKGYQKSNKAVLFTPPSARAGLKLFPLNYGGFATPGGTAEYKLSVKNTGELGDDTFDLKTSCKWPLLVYAHDGATLLSDTDMDRKIDTGPVASGDTVDVVVKVSPLATAKVGESKVCKITFTSSLKSSRKVTASLTTTIPTYFTQAYDKDTPPDYGGVNGYYSTGTELIDFAIPSTGDGWHSGVHERLDGNQFFTWSEYSCTDSSCEQVMYQVMNPAGGVEIGPINLRIPPADTYEYGVSAVTAPNGVTGMVFMNEVRVPATNQFVMNVFFTALDENGAVLVEPFNLSENTVPYQYDSDDGNFLYFPKITATEGSRFFVTWSQDESTNYVNNIFYEVLASDGSIVYPRTNFTNDPSEDVSGFYDGTVTSLTGDRVLLAYNGWGIKGRSWSEYAIYAVLNNDGTVYKPQTAITLGRLNSGWMDAVQTSNGQIVMVWSVEKSEKYLLQYAILKDGTYKKAKGPVPLSVKAALTGIHYPSVTQDAEGRAVITCNDNDASFSRYLYYALIGNNGAPLTKPVIFMTAETGTYLFLSEYGNGNGSFTPDF